MKNLLFTLALILVSTITFAQQFDIADTNPGAKPNDNISRQKVNIVPTVYDEEEEMGRAEIRPSKPINYNKKPKSVTSSFTGFKVELLTSAKALDYNHTIFNDFGKITLEQINETFHYTIGTFSSSTRARDFAQRVVAPRYTMYKIVEYKEGKRVTMNAN